MKDLKGSESIKKIALMAQKMLNIAYMVDII